MDSLASFNADETRSSLFYSENADSSPVITSDNDLLILEYQLNNVDGTDNSHIFRNLLLKYPLNILGSSAEGMLDSGASDNFMSTRRAKFLESRFGLKRTPLQRTTAAKLANGGTISCTHILKQVPIQLGEYHFLADFKILNMNQLDVVLGKPWLTDVNPIIDFKCNNLCIRTPLGDHIITPNLQYSHVDHGELNLMHLDHFLRMQHERSDSPTMCFSLHEIGTDIPSQYANDIQSEIVQTNGGIYNLWVHDVSLLSAEDIPKPVETVSLTPQEKALKQWKETHPSKQSENQDFDPDSHAKVESLVKTYINIHIPHEHTPPGQTVKGVSYRHKIIEMPGSTPKMQQPYRLSPTEMKALKEWIDNMLKRGFLR